VIRALRLRLTRGLWDPTYRDESWIREPVALVPRVRSWVTTENPGTKLVIGEYSWGVTMIRAVPWRKLKF
jgi:hypothetical protein